MHDKAGIKNTKGKEKALKDLIARARFLSYIGLFAIFIFMVLLVKLYPNLESSRWLFAFAVVMEFFSFGFFLLARRIMGILGTNPSDEEIVKWADFLSLYYYPKFIFRKKRNPFIVRDDED